MVSMREHAYDVMRASLNVHLQLVALEAQQLEVCQLAKRLRQARQRVAHEIERGQPHETAQLIRHTCEAVVAQVQVRKGRDLANCWWDGEQGIGRCHQCLRSDEMYVNVFSVELHMHVEGRQAAWAGHILWC